MKNRCLLATLLIGGIALVFVGCKEDAIVKASITPGNNVLVTDTLGDTITVISKTVLLDQLETSEKKSGLRVVQGLGSIVDPFFGKTSAGIHLQVLPPSPEFSFTADNNPYVIDSAILILPYTGYSWGYSEAPKIQNITVYELTDRLSVDEKYYSNQVIGINRTTPISAAHPVDFKGELEEEPILGNGDSTKSKHLRIPLNQTFIDRFDNEVKNNRNSFATDDNFLSFFKGIYIEPDTTQSADLLAYFFLDGNSNYNRASIAFYYKENGDTASKVKFFDYNRDKSAHYNWIGRNYTNTPAQSIINRYSSTLNTSDDTIILQNEPGAAIDLRFPYISSLPRVTILKAEIVITKITTGNEADSLASPNRLIPSGVDASGVEYEIADYDASNVTAAVAFIDGNKAEEKDDFGNDVTRYRINIPKEMQKIINGERDELHLRIKGATGFPAAYRLVAGGRNHGTYKVQLNIVYSKPD